VEGEEREARKGKGGKEGVESGKETGVRKERGRNRAGREGDLSRFRQSKRWQPYSPRFNALKPTQPIFCGACPRSPVAYW